METREELKKQYKEATIRFDKAQKRYNSLLSPKEGEEVLTFKPTPEYGAKLEKAEQEMKDAADKQREILGKLHSLPR